LIKKDIDAYGSDDKPIVDSTQLHMQKLEKEIEGDAKKEEAQTQPEQKKWTNLNNLVKKLGGLVVQKYLETP
jgi:hypothetical protein